MEGDTHTKSVAVILASGVGERFGGDVPKQYVELQGVPIVMHSLLTFDSLHLFDLLVIVARDEEFPRLRAMQERVNIISPVAMVSGGATRAESAYRAVEALSGYEDATSVLIHDAARPLMSCGLAERMLDALRDCRAAVPGIRSSDAILELQPNGACAPRRPRDVYRLVQTPQAFQLGVVRRAYARAFDGAEMTWDDDASVVARFLPEVEVKYVEGERENFKITHHEDLVLADMILKRRGEK